MKYQIIINHQGKSYIWAAFPQREQAEKYFQYFPEEACIEIEKFTISQVELATMTMIDTNYLETGMSADVRQRLVVMPAHLFRKEVAH